MTREAFLIHLMTYIAVPYIWGSKVPSKGLDCSGLVWNIMLDLKAAPHYGLNAQGLMDHYMPISRPVAVKDADLGDLVFFGDADRIHHVGMCLGNGMMIEAAHGDQTVTSVEIAKERGASVQANPLARRNDLFIILRLPQQLFTR